MDGAFFLDPGCHLFSSLDRVGGQAKQIGCGGGSGRGKEEDNWEGDPQGRKEAKASREARDGTGRRRRRTARTQ